MWHSLTEKYTEKVAEDVLAAPYRDLFADGTLFESRPFVRNWIAARANRLNRVPDEVYGAVAQIIDSATTNGASIPDVTGQIEQLFGDTDVQKWKNRARTVARTEVVGAYNGGLHDAFAMIVENDPGMLLGASLPVGILDPEDVGAPGMPGIEPIEERGPGAPDVEVTGWRRSETDARCGHGER